MVLLQRKLYFPKDPKGAISGGGGGGGQLFPGGGGAAFSRGGGGGVEGSKNLFSIETHPTCDFPGGPDPLTPSGSTHGLEPGP